MNILISAINFSAPLTFGQSTRLLAEGEHPRIGEVVLQNSARAAGIKGEVRRRIAVSDDPPNISVRGQEAEEGDRTKHARLFQAQEEKERLNKLAGIEIPSSEKREWQTFRQRLFQRADKAEREKRRADPK